MKAAYDLFATRLPNAKINFVTNVRTAGPRAGKVAGNCWKNKGQTTFSIVAVNYADDQVNPSKSRQDLIDITNSVRSILSPWGIEIHVAKGDETSSKTEANLFPLKGQPQSSGDTSPLILADGSRIYFNTRFTYLGSVITDDLTDNVSNEHPTPTARLEKT
jgi:hypothetical protein